MRKVLIVLIIIGMAILLFGCLNTAPEDNEVPYEVGNLINESDSGTLNHVYIIHYKYDGRDFLFDESKTLIKVYQTDTDRIYMNVIWFILIFIAVFIVGLLIGTLD